MYACVCKCVYYVCVHAYHYVCVCVLDGGGMTAAYINYGVFSSSVGIVHILPSNVQPHTDQLVFCIA